MMKKVLFTGGGSAGHVVPNLALIEELLSAGAHDVCYIGTDGIEKTLVSEWNIPYYTIECPKLVRGGGFAGFKSNCKIPAAFLRAVGQAKQGLLTFRPDVVFSKGGYVALPVVFAARKLKIPCIAHESDFSIGLANRISAWHCAAVYTAFPETAKKLRRGKYAGAPIRRSVLSATKADARRKLSIPFDEKVLLVLGGGSGSRTVNEALRKRLKDLTQRYCILHLCGKGNVVESNLKNYRQFEYISDIGLLYAAADAVISRAGAGALFELMALKKPALLIPLEGPTRGDQLQNAEYFAKKGLCRILRQTALENLPQAIDGVFADERMKERLSQSELDPGNAVLLRAIAQAIKT